MSTIYGEGFVADRTRAATIEQANARSDEVQAETNRLIASLIRDNLRDNPGLGMTVSRDFAQRLQEVLAEVAQLPRESVKLAGMQGRCKAMAGILGELLS